MATNETPEQIAEAEALAVKRVEAAAAEVAAAATKALSDEATANASGKTVVLVGMSAVFGDVHHPFTHKKFEVGQVSEHEHDVWTKAQVEAGKLTLV